MPGGSDSSEARAYTTELLAQLHGSQQPIERRVALHVLANPNRSIVNEAAIYFCQSMALLYGADEGLEPFDGVLAFLLLCANDYCFEWFEPDARVLSRRERVLADTARASRFNIAPDLIHDIAQAQAFIPDRRARAVAHELFESSFTSGAVGGDREPRVQVEALDLGLQRPERPRNPALRALHPHAPKRRARPWAECLGVHDGSAVAGGEDRLAVRNRIHPVDLLAEPSVPTEMTQDPAAHGPEQFVKLLIAWRRQGVKREVASLAGREQAIHHQHMRMHVETLPLIDLKAVLAKMSIKGERTAQVQAFHQGEARRIREREVLVGVAGDDLARFVLIVFGDSLHVPDVAE